MLDKQCSDGLQRPPTQGEERDPVPEFREIDGKGKARLGNAVITSAVV
jgi:hypothetical protein